MKVIIYDPKAVDKKFKKVSLDYLLKNSDIISLHCPHNPLTHHLINEKNIEHIKKGALLVNTARGGLIETKALVKALANKNLGGAALDVLEEESLVKEEIQLLSHKFPQKDLENLLENHLLLTFNNVIITPHNAFNSHEALMRILEVTVQNINSVVANNKKRNYL